SSNPVGINEIVPSFSSVYPNPAKDLITVAFDNMLAGGSVEVYNSLGKQVMKQSFTDSKEVKLNIEKLNTGTFYVYVKTTDGKIQSHRVVKVK
ncbi:MAG: T9SS C-terminal target domain-containing protein, partial [Flavobacteriales bacterium]|nr:T9SS C-terminal target domain-containing protein [Flavobacteriales bacterium]